MTIHLADLAIYQGGLRPSDLDIAGFGVNIKVSHGVTQKNVHPQWRNWAVLAQAAGMRVSTFHWMTDEAGGEDQAEYAYRQIVSAGLLYETAHQLDVESEPRPSLNSVRGYLGRMTQLLNRPVALYTGDWYWPASWDVSALTPYLWAAPNAGYLGTYPGDTSAHWRAGYGGWPNLAVMQYAVNTLPGGSIKVSKSAIRDETVWRDLTYGRTGMSYAPSTIMAARALFMNCLRTAGLDPNPASFGVVGDDSHAQAGTGYHVGKDALKSTAYSIVESSRDKNGLTNAASALDVGWFSFTVKGKLHNLRSFSVWLVAQCKAGTADTKDIREVIYSTDGAVVKRWDRLGIRTTGDSSHLTHTHLSWFRDSENRDKTALFRRYFTEIGILEDPDMAMTIEDADLFINRLMARKIETPQGDFGSLLGVFSTLMVRTDHIGNVQNPAALNALKAILANVQADDGDVARLTAAINASSAATSAAAAQAVRDVFSSDGDPADIKAALIAALGQEKAEAAARAILNG